ncbi:hypothetical protein CLTEP_02240 [Clostridium tepidiprofundi DSM 19306]|uniref:Phage XkdN-like protein n=1 Tax=Clostridium tepidiprofundi DSM 19306 TaxID=1121338 RepID=A0A151B7A9_9CLOT|nr:hypothetical protein [Clostridium tepidiprofundi]KYH35831.1 hypothetical protein CLTEP_02240 [Clostridium tepidiprofundi DSM 19306]
MSKGKKLTLDDFRKKALQREKAKKLFTFIDVDGFGEIRFERPTDNEILRYMNECARAVKVDEKGNVTEQDLSITFEASKELVYVCCPFLQDRELREELDIKDPLDVVSKIFGINGTIEIASQIVEEFEGGKLTEQVVEDVKN